ncbi:putative transposase [Sphingobium sp. SYK-6]|uniref:transposase n=1 Tax=Sphingobium sp. (strain NBRC 103272 / SYK-6) TaxID=627192 RepID=UPI00022771A6|nr:transposase [Sphingobium sp. SYK-6]BAK66412.1 putative transposase [Sphingobium sp. SYK-6]
MRFAAVGSEEQQAARLVFRTRDLVMRQRTQFINPIRGHLAEYGWVAPRGTAHVTMFADLLEDEEMISTLSEAARPMFKLLVELLPSSTSKSPCLTVRSAEPAGGRRCPAADRFYHRHCYPLAGAADRDVCNSRDFAAWLGLAPRRRSRGGKQRLGSISKKGERTIRRLLIIGGSTVRPRS